MTVLAYFQQLTYTHIVPTNLEYSEEQEVHFNNPEEHEEEFADHLKIRLKSHPDQTLPMFTHEKRSYDEISPHYVAHLQKWFELMYVYCIANIMFNQSCDIIHAVITYKEQNIQLNLIEIRPCAQKLGLINCIYKKAPIYLFVYTIFLCTMNAKCGITD